MARHRDGKPEGHRGWKGWRYGAQEPPVWEMPWNIKYLVTQWRLSRRRSPACASSQTHPDLRPYYRWNTRAYCSRSGSGKQARFPTSISRCHFICLPRLSASFHSSSCAARTRRYPRERSCERYQLARPLSAQCVVVRYRAARRCKLWPRHQPTGALSETTTRGKKVCVVTPLFALSVSRRGFCAFCTFSLSAWSERRNNCNNCNTITDHRVF